MSEQQFGWNYFENEVVIGDKQDKKRMIVLVFSNFMDIVYNRKSFDEIVGLLNRQQTSIETMLGNMEKLEKENEQLKRQNKALKDNSLTDAYFDYLENSRTVTLKEAEEPIRVTKYEELFDDE